MSDISVLSDQAVRLLSDIGATWPDALLVAPETADLTALRELDYVEQWDMLPNGDRRWTITHEGRVALGHSVRAPT